MPKEFIKGFRWTPIGKALRLLELEALITPGGHVGDNDAVAGLQAFCDLDAVIGATAQDNVEAVGLFVVIGKLKEGERRAAVGMESSGLELRKEKSGRLHGRRK
jgi:hypothetical protein